MSAKVSKTFKCKKRQGVQEMAGGQPINPLGWHQLRQVAGASDEGANSKEVLRALA